MTLSAKSESIEAKSVGALLAFLERQSSAWIGARMTGNPIWKEALSDSELDELRRLVARGIPAGRTLDQLRAADLPLPRLGSRIREWREELDVKRGFLLVQRLPVEEWSEAQATLAYWAICNHLGTLKVQNSRGTMLGHVRNEGYKMSLANPKIRINETNNKIRFHVDLGDVVGLLCLQNSMSGGISRIVSSHTVVAEILRRRPALESTLFEPIPFDALDMAGATGRSWRDVPICRWRRDDLRVSFQADTIATAQERGEAPRLTEAQADMVSMIEEIAEDPKFHLDMNFEVGEIQFINNNHTLHSRTSWEDGADPGKRRHLLRAWMTLD
jgi:hypothetical protein